MSHDFSCERHPTFVPMCEACEQAKRDYWQNWQAQQKPVAPTPVKDSGAGGGGKLQAGKNPRPLPAPAVSARNTDPESAHSGVQRIVKSMSKNAAKILALDFPADGLNYRQIAEDADIYPTTCSRVITDMVRNGTLLLVGEVDGCRVYTKEDKA